MAKQTIEDGIQIPVEPVTEDQQGMKEAQQQKLFSEDEVHKIRQQEKDKMYKRLEDADGRVKAMEEQLSIINAEREKAIKEAEERARKESEILRQREVEELSAKELLAKREDEFNQRINQVEEEWSRKFSELDAQRQAQEAILEKERYMQQLDTYRQRRLQDEQETIIPELRDLVSGNTEEEIESSISVLRERSNAIIESIQRASQPTRPKGAPVTAPPTGPLENQQEYQTLTADDIRNMPMDQYVKMRDRLLNARTQRGRF
jgi:DNA repair exonuclease SbcCD ATPase subunit